MKIKKVIYRPIVAKYVDGLPVFWLIKETSYFGFSLFYELIGQDRNGEIPFQTVEELEERVKYLNLK